MESSAILRILIGGKVALIPAFLPARGWSIHTKGYLIYTSRKKGMKWKRGKRAHVAVFEHLSGKVIEPGFQVHHQNFNKLDCRPENLINLPYEMNPTPNRHCQDPYTGQFLSPGEYARRYGNPYTNTPDWVTENLCAKAIA